MIEGRVLLLKKDDLKGRYPNGIIFYVDEGTGGGH